MEIVMLGFIISIGAGFLTPHLEQPLAKPLAAAIGKWVKVEEGELTLLAFMIALIGAAVLSAFFASGSTMGIILGGVLGYFGSRIVEAVKTAMDNRNKD
jgi:hypothetical protein